jgi:hypothetical protein
MLLQKGFHRLSFVEALYMKFSLTFTATFSMRMDEKFPKNVAVLMRQSIYIYIDNPAPPPPPPQVQLMFSIFRLGLFYNEVLLDTVI